MKLLNVSVDTLELKCSVRNPDLSKLIHYWHQKPNGKGLYANMAEGHLTDSPKLLWGLPRSESEGLFDFKIRFGFSSLFDRSISYYLGSFPSNFDWRVSKVDLAYDYRNLGVSNYFDVMKNAGTSNEKPLPTTEFKEEGRLVGVWSGNSKFVLIRCYDKYRDILESKCPRRRAYLNFLGNPDNLTRVEFSFKAPFLHNKFEVDLVEDYYKPSAYLPFLSGFFGRIKFRNKLGHKIFSHLKSNFKSDSKRLSLERIDAPPLKEFKSGISRIRSYITKYLCYSNSKFSEDLDDFLSNYHENGVPLSFLIDREFDDDDLIRRNASSDVMEAVKDHIDIKQQTILSD